MDLSDDERRKLGDIERGLAEGDPRLARRFSAGQPVTAGSIAAMIAAGLLMLGAGVIIIVNGARLGAPLVIVCGVVVVLVLPFMAWLARRP